MDSDKEDGELSEADATLHAPKGTAQDATPRESPPTPQEQLRQDREAAKQFIKLLHSNNVPYRILADEQLDPELLRGLYQSVNLPSEPAPILPPKPQSAASNAPAVQPIAPAQQDKLPAVKTNIILAPSAKAAASPTTPVDRKDYIARLQAAKAAKQAALAKPISPSHHPLPPKPMTPTPTAKTPQPATTPTAKPPVTDEQRARNTELIKQRLEAIKARQKSSGAVSNSTAPPAISSTPTEQTPTTQPATTATVTFTGQSHTPSFSGIPGLFMNTPSVSNAPVSIASRPAPPAPQMRPASQDTARASAPQAPVTPHNRPLGQSQYAQQDDDDSMIIEVSEDESNGSDMDIEDDQPAPKGVQTPHRAIGSLPSRAASAIPVPSAISSSGAQTPTTVAREKELVDKEKQLVAMRETLKRKLAEKRERDRAAAAAASAVTTPSSLQQPSTPVLPPQTATPTKLPTPMMESAPLSPHDAPVDAARSNTGPGKDTARIRRAEIQSRLPTLDAEIASNANRMAQLMKEMEELTAQNERIAKDKAQLTKELESLGVDTEGMSHAELRAKKDEIEREQPSESNLPPREVSSEVPPLQQSAALASHSPTQITNTTLDVSAASGTNVKSPAQHQSGLSESPLAPSSVEVPPMDNTTLSGIQNSTTALEKDGGEDTYSAPPAQMDLGVGEVQGESGSSRKPPIAQTDTAMSSSQEGEVEMSVSEGEEDEEDYEPEYDPEEHAIVTDTPTQDAQLPGMKLAPSNSTSRTPAEDEEAYEPPDVDQEMSDVQSEEGNDASHVGQAEPDDGAMDIATSSEDSSDDSDSDSDSDSDEESAEEPADENSIPANMSHRGTNIADDLAPELQLENKAAVVAVEPVRTSPFVKPS